MGFRWVVLVYLLCLFFWLLFNILVLMPRSTAPKGEPFQTGDRLRGLSLGMTAGSLAGNMFCMKALVKLIQATVEDHSKAEYWLDWLPYALVVGSVFFAVANLYFLAKAMREYEALFMGAVFEGSLITAGCVSGIVVFSEVEGLDLWKVGLYWLAVIIIVIGIGTVSIACMRKRQVETMVQDITTESTPELESTIESGASVSIERLRLPTRASIKRSLSSEIGPFRDMPVIALEMNDTFSRRTTVIYPDETTCSTGVPDPPATSAPQRLTGSSVTARCPASQRSSAHRTSSTQHDRTPSPEARPVSDSDRHDLQPVSASLN